MKSTVSNRRYLHSLEEEVNTGRRTKRRQNESEVMTKQGLLGIVRRESFDPEWPKPIGIKPRNANFDVKNVEKTIELNVTHGNPIPRATSQANDYSSFRSDRCAITSSLLPQRSLRDNIASSHTSQR